MSNKKLLEEIRLECLEHYAVMINEAEKLKDKIYSIQDPEFEYPMVFEHKDTGIIVKFDALKSGVVLKKDDFSSVGHYYDDWIMHDNSTVWKQIPHCYINGELYYDKQPVYAWDNVRTIREIHFIDAINKRLFSGVGKRNSLMWFDNYEPYPHDDEWIKEHQEQLED